MKKFYNKISKQQWRMSIPNIGSGASNIFSKRSASVDKDAAGVAAALAVAEDDLEPEDSSGVTKSDNVNGVQSYELQPPPPPPPGRASERSKSAPIRCAIDSSDNTSDDTDNYEDAAASVQHSSSIKAIDDDDEEDDACEEGREVAEGDEGVDANLYADIEPKESLETVEEEPPGTPPEYEYDIPKISFSFFELGRGKRSDNNENDDGDDEEFSPHYEVLNIKRPQQPEGDVTDSKHTERQQQEPSSPVHKSEIKIRLSTPPEILERMLAEAATLSKKDIEDEDADGDIYQTPTTEVPPLPEANVENLVKHAKCHTKSLENVNHAHIYSNKSGSESNIAQRLSTTSYQEDDEEVYKVPGQVRRYRLSMSLDDFNDGPDGEEGGSVTSGASSIDHISCSQVLAQKAMTEPDVGDSRNSASMEYCKARSKLPAKIRRATLLRRPKQVVVGDKWENFKSRFNNIVTTHAAGQRVGAYAGKEKFSINIEEIYKNSRSKCRSMLRKSTLKLFKKREVPSLTTAPSNNSDSASIVKNDAFFAKVDHQNRCERDDKELSVNSNKVPQDIYNNCSDTVSDTSGFLHNLTLSSRSPSAADERTLDFDFSTLKKSFRRSRLINELKGQNGFDDLRKYVKQGGDFCKELSAILQERSEAEIQYAKSLSKLSAKLSRACREGVGGMNDGWRMVAGEMEGRAEIHRSLGAALLEECARPLRQLTETQHRSRKQSEASADKAAKGLGEWRAAEAKSKKHSHVCARDNEKLQDALLDVRLSRSSSLIQLTHAHKNVSDKENTKLEGKKRKAEDAVKKADIEYYTLCVRAERARLEWESAVLRGTGTFQGLEEERLNNLKSILTAYMHHSSELGPRHNEHTERLRAPVAQCDPAKDLVTFTNLRQTSQQVAEQLLPDFYCEHITLAMNRERRKQALVKLLQLIRQDIERERKSKNGLENLSKAIKQTPNFGNEDSQQNVTEKLYHMRSMLTYLEGARYKVQAALAELDSRPRGGHPLAGHITITRDKSGLQQSILKVPQWLREDWTDPEKSPISEKNEITVSEVDPGDWLDRGTADGNSNQPDSDFDEFSSQASSTEISPSLEDSPVQPIAQCKALYAYTANLPDELTLKPGDILAVYRQQEDGWWLGECGGNVGIFPATYVETVPSPT